MNRVCHSSDSTAGTAIFAYQTLAVHGGDDCWIKISRAKRGMCNVIHRDTAEKKGKKGLLSTSVNPSRNQR